MAPMTQLLDVVFSISNNQDLDEDKRKKLRGKKDKPKLWLSQLAMLLAYPSCPREN